MQNVLGLIPDRGKAWQLTRETQANKDVNPTKSGCNHPNNNSTQSCDKVQFHRVTKFLDE